MCHHTPLTCTGTSTAGASTTLGDDVEEAPGSVTNKKAKKGEAKKGEAKKGKAKKGKAKKGKAKAKGNAEEWQSEDDTESDGSDGSVKVPMARGRWDLPRAKRGSSTQASSNYGHDDTDSDYAASVASAAPSNYSSA